MRNMDVPQKLDFKLETSFTKFGEFVYKEAQSERLPVEEQKPAKQPTLIYVLPQSTAAVAEL